MPKEPATIISTLQSNAEGLAKTTEIRAQNAMAIPHQFLSLLEQAPRDWLRIAEREAQLASELTVALSSSKSVPEMAKAYQDWMSERLVMFNQESQRMFANAQRFMASAVTMMSNGAAARQ
jgi:hypothetical protein